MTNSSSDRPGEFELIARLFAPLSRNAPGAYGLTDDAATITPRPGEELVITADLLSAGVHFRAGDPPDRIAKKALRVNLSDLAAKGAVPSGYLLSLALPRTMSVDWLTAFARGLEQDQIEFSVSLLGGDTTATDGPLTIAITAFGAVPAGTMIRRSGAKPGDLVFVTGTIGDAGAGLELLKAGRVNDALVDRYQLPTPRVVFGQALRGVASAALDVSDGLLADLGHIAQASGAGLIVEADRVPLSPALKQFRDDSPDPVIMAATAGDDYEIAFTAPITARIAVASIATQTNTPVMEIGRVVEGEGVVLTDSAGQEIVVSRKGYEHF
jgi:thiamine-monophosphate kinase